MFDIIANAAPTDLPDAFAEIHAFAAEHREALLNASEWLGGAGGYRLAIDVIDSLCYAHASPRNVLRVLGDLLDLLMLENVHDTDLEEAGIFAGLDPRDPRVDEVCLLADGLAAKLAACEAEAGECAADLRRAAA